MTYKCLIVDDEELARRLLINHLSNLDNFELVAACESAIEANKILKEQVIDLLFLDIEMPVLKGIDFFKNLINKPKVIFTTAYRDYALDGFELDAVDYLLKPITFARFFKSIEKFESLQNPTSAQKIEETSSSRKSDFVFIREDRKQIKIQFEDILYIESLKDYIKVHTPQGSHMTKFSITTFQESLDDRFIRIHRSFIINLDKVTAYTAEDVELSGIELPIGQSYKSEIARFLNPRPRFKS